MNRILFNSLFSILVITECVLVYLDVKSMEILLFFALSILVLLRRIYLKMTSWWGGGFRDILAYIKNP